MQEQQIPCKDPNFAMGASSVLLGVVISGSGSCLFSDKSLLQEFLLFPAEILIAWSLPPVFSSVNAIVFV